MPKYAANTSVSASDSRAEIERTLERYGATGFVYGWQDNTALVGFSMNARQVRFYLSMPEKEEFRHTPTHRYWRDDATMLKEWEKATRQRWRALALVVKAKLEAIESGISTFENEFLANIVMPDGQTVGQHVKEQVEIAYKTGKMPALMPAFPALQLPAKTGE